MLGRNFFFEVNVNIAYKPREVVQAGSLSAFHANLKTPASFNLLPAAYRKRTK